MRELSGRAAAVTDLETYRIKKALAKQLADAENDVLIVRSKLSKYINALLLDHNCAAGEHNKMTIDELFRIVTAYENKEFRDNYFPNKRLRDLAKNNTNLRLFEFELHVAQQIRNGKFKPYKNANKFKTKELCDKQIASLKKKVESCTDRKKSLEETFRSMQYAKLIKRFDTLAHKTHKNAKTSNIHSDYVIDFENITKYYYNK